MTTYRACRRKSFFYAFGPVLTRGIGAISYFMPFSVADLKIAGDRSRTLLACDRESHLLGATIGVKAAFVQSGKYHHRGDRWHLVSDL